MATMDSIQPLALLISQRGNMLYCGSWPPGTLVLGGIAEGFPASWKSSQDPP